MKKLIAHISVGTLFMVAIFAGGVFAPSPAFADTTDLSGPQSNGSCAYYNPIPITNGKLPATSIYQGLVIPDGATYACAYPGGGGYQFFDASGNRLGAATGGLLQPTTNFDKNGTPSVAPCDADIRTWSAFFNTSCWGPMISGVVSGALVYVASWILTVSGLLFNWTLTQTILQFGNLVNQNVITGINTAWSVGRDISNIIIIGLFVFIAIMTILGSNEYGVRRMLANVLIIAILMNFSLLFAKIIIDASNFIAIQFYNASSTLVAQTTDSSGNANFTNANGGSLPAGVSGAFMQYAGVSSFGDTYLAVGNLAKKQNSWIALLFGMLTALLFLVAAIVLFYGTFLLVSRALVLIFLMITASLAFATYLWPKFSESGYGWSAWWNALLKNAVFAPLLMFFLWVTLTLGAAFSKNTGSLGKLITDPQSALNINALLGYVIVIGLLFISFKLSSSFSSAVSGLNVGQGAFNWLARATGGGVARGGAMAWQAAAARFRGTGAAPAAGAGRPAARASSAPLANIPATTQIGKPQPRQRLQLSSLPAGRTGIGAEPRPALTAVPRPTIAAEPRPALPAPGQEDVVKTQREANARIESNQKELADLLKKQTDATNTLTQTNQEYAAAQKTIESDADDRRKIGDKYSEEMLKKQIEAATANLDPAKRGEVEQDIRRNSEEQRASELRHQNDRIEQARAKLTQISSGDPELSKVEKQIAELHGEIETDRKVLTDATEALKSQGSAPTQVNVQVQGAHTDANTRTEIAQEGTAPVSAPDVVASFRGANKRIVRPEIFRPNATDVSAHTEVTIHDNPLPPQQKAA